MVAAAVSAQTAQAATAARVAVEAAVAEAMVLERLMAMRQAALVGVTAEPEQTASPDWAEVGSP